MMLRHTQQRAAIRSALERVGRPLSPQELLLEARVQVPEIGQATIYRAIKPWWRNNWRWR
jgi:Fe2+ or Zn2+ uptake regulation protein